MTTGCKSIAVALFLLLSTAVVFSIPQVAVLDAVLAPGMDPSVAGPVTDKIIEELLNSRRFTVLDRANVEQILQEKEFQLSSGVVRNEEIRRAGEYLGADFVIVANVSRVGSTYVISARMIDVVYGEIIAQASSEKQGKIDVILEIARIVGKQISGQENVVAEATEKLEEKKQAEAVQQPVSGSNPMAVAQLQELIRTGTHMKRGGDRKMQPFVAQIGEQERLFLYTVNRKNDAASGFLLNLVIPYACVGSWIQGDVRGAVTSYALLLSGGLAIASGIEQNSDMVSTGIVLIAVDVVYYCLRPFSFVRQWNRNLATILKVPYIALMDPKQSTIGVVKSDSRNELQFRINLVSIEY